MERSAQRLGRALVVIVDDRVAHGEQDDNSGPLVTELLEEAGFIVDGTVAVEGEVVDIRAALNTAVIGGVDLVVTVGGTGVSPRDVTPEATTAVCEKMMPGFGELMRATSLKFVPTAILSRQTAGIRGKCLIVNLPGRPKAIRENLEAVFPAIPYCVDLIGGPRLETNEATMKVFRPKS